MDFAEELRKPVGSRFSSLPLSLMLSLEKLEVRKCKVYNMQERGADSLVCRAHDVGTEREQTGTISGRHS